MLFRSIFVTIHNLTAFFDTIHGSHCTISINFYFYLRYFQQKVFSFSKISRSQMDPSLNYNNNIKKINYKDGYNGQ